MIISAAWISAAHTKLLARNGPAGWRKHEAAQVAVLILRQVTLAEAKKVLKEQQFNG